MRYKWRYEGPVVEFGKCICNYWSGETTAVSEKEAQNNLKYQFKKQNNKTAASKITMPGKLVRIM